MTTARDKLFIFDTTLRDGEQSPGASMSPQDKLRIAKQLEFLGVDVIEAGFAAASPGDFESICAISKVIRNSTVCSLARANPSDVRKAGEAIAAAPRRRIHTFIATSPLHMEKKLNMTPEQVISRAVEAIRIAKEYTDDIEFSCEDASRSQPEFEKAQRRSIFRILSDMLFRPSSAPLFAICGNTSITLIRLFGPFTAITTSDLP